MSANRNANPADPLRRHLAVRGDVTIEVLDQGDGPAVLILPSLGRGADDYDGFATLLTQRGLRVVRPQPRGIGRSRGPLDGLTMHDLAADVEIVIAQLRLAPAIVAGHAFGNFVARMLATIRPDLVRGVAILAGSPGMLPDGGSPYEPRILEALMRCGDLSLTDEIRLDAIQEAFFSPGHDGRVWLDGWHPQVKAAQRQADAATPVSVYFASGDVPILDVQAANDAIARPRHAHLLAQQLGERVRTVVVQDAGHALIPEQPVAVADALVSWVETIVKP